MKLEKLQWLANKHLFDSSDILLEHIKTEAKERKRKSLSDGLEWKGFERKRNVNLISYGIQQAWISQGEKMRRKKIFLMNLLGKVFDSFQ